MAKLGGIFNQFLELDKIPLAEINKWLTNKIEPHILSNHIGNLIQYPQSIPVRIEDLEIDFAILKAYLQKDPRLVFDTRSKEIRLPIELVNRFPKIQTLMLSLAECLNLPEVTRVYAHKFLGTIIAPVAQNAKDPVQVIINQKTYKLKLGSISILPLIKQNLKMTLNQDRNLMVEGGEVGLVLDLRKVSR